MPQVETVGSMTLIFTFLKLRLSSGFQAGAGRSGMSERLDAATIFGKASPVRPIRSNLVTSPSVIATSFAALVVAAGTYTTVTANTKQAQEARAVKGTATILPAAALALTPQVSSMPNQVGTRVASSSPKLGINLAETQYWNNERSFMNLVLGGTWSRVTPAGSWTSMPSGQVDPSGTVKFLPTGEKAALMLMAPAQNVRGVAIRCTFDGSGTLAVGGEATGTRVGNKNISFNWSVDYRSLKRVWLVLERTEASDPLRNIDCREADAPRSQVFAQEFKESLRPYGVLRFLGWQLPNQNQGGNWAQRTRPHAIQVGRDGVAVEHMVALATEVGADPWFIMPWHADEQYITEFASYVHKNLPTDRKIYVEVGNEIWNSGFPVAQIAQDEGLAAGLSTNPFEARMRRYAQKSAAALKIWTRVFANHPDRLVRVVSTQHAVPNTAEMVLSFADTANYVDALATAPYFGNDLLNTPEKRARPVEQLQIELAADADRAIEFSLRNKAVAARYGKRHVTYEAGQHVVSREAVPLVAALNRHPKMYDIYTRYINRWMSSQGDLMVLLASTSAINEWGAWGLREYSGQPLGETPKRRAVMDVAPTLNAGAAPPAAQKPRNVGAVSAGTSVSTPAPRPSAQSSSSRKSSAFS
jgi:hypothetical protein